MGLTVYYAPMTSATRILWALEELGVAYEKVKLDLAAGEHKKPEYLALNPNGQVPLLVVDGTPIFESAAILAYLGETYGVDAGLFPPPSVQRGVALKWLAWTAVSLGEPATRWLRAAGPRTPPEQRDERAAQAALQDFFRLTQIVETELSSRPYLMGESFTLVDMPAFGLFSFAARLGVDLTAFPRVREWIQRCSSRPALQRAMAM